jgi:hypothetical protein
MRNNTMRETLEAALSAQNPALAGRSNEDVLSAVKATEREIRKEAAGKKPRTIAIGRHPILPTNTTLSRLKNSLSTASSRYIAPPNKVNPFSKHAFIGEPKGSIVDELNQASQPAIQPSEDTKPSAAHWFGTTTSQPESQPASEPAGQQVSEKSDAGSPTHLAENAGPRLVDSERHETTSKTEATAPHAEAGTPAATPANTNHSPGTPVATPAPVTLTNLAFLETRTAFSGELSGMVEKLRTARTAIAFTMEQLRGRRKKTEEELKAKQQELEGIDEQMNHARENLRKIEDTISASALLAEQAAGIDPGMFSAKNAHGKAHVAVKAAGNKYGNRWDTSNPTILRIADARQFFQEHKDAPRGVKGWTSAAILAAMPEGKRAHGKTALPAMLKTLADEGTVERVDRGMYKAASSC